MWVCSICGGYAEYRRFGVAYCQEHWNRGEPHERVLNSTAKNIGTEVSRMKEYSIVLPTRERLAGLKTLLDSIQKTTITLDNIEVLLVCDQNDPTLDRVFQLTNKYELDISMLCVPRSENFSRDYMNFGASNARGKNLWMMNDDVVFETHGWDAMVKSAIGTRQVYMVDTWCTDHEELHSFPRFPMISRKAYEAVGFVFFPEIRMWGADAVLFDMYKNAGCVIPCHEVRLAHNHMPSKRFYDIYAEDKRDGLFPVPALDETNRLKAAKEQYDGGTTVPGEMQDRPGALLPEGAGDRPLE